MNGLKIDIIDNGFILSYVKHSALNQRPEPVSLFFSNKDELVEHLSGVLE
jgi:hypothetical protein